jgi:Glycosyltransferase family 87
MELSRAPRTLRGMEVAFRRIAPVALFALLPAAVLLFVIVSEWRHSGTIAPDFREALYPQAKELRRSGVPFDPPHVTLTGENHVYTILAAATAIPLTWLPVGVAAVLWTALSIVALPATLYFLGVRDSRVFGVVFLYGPVISAIQSGNLTLPLCFVAALAWNYRSHRYLPGLLVGLAFALKVNMWPMAVWLVATRRWRALLATIATAGLSVLLIWPFANPVDYFTLAHRNADWGAPWAYSVYALLGATQPARIVWLGVAAVALLWTARVHDDRRSFGLALVGCILCSPIVWVQYFTFLILPLAVIRPRFGPLWVLPLLYWLVPKSNGATWQILLALGVMLVVAGELVTRRPAGPVSRGALLGRSEPIV